MSFDPQQFIDDIRFMAKRYEVAGTRHAFPQDLDLKLIAWDDPDDLGDPGPPLGAVAISPDEFELLKEYLFRSLDAYSNYSRSWGLKPQRNLNNPRQFRLSGVTIQIVDAQKLGLEHLEPGSYTDQFSVYNPVDPLDRFDNNMSIRK